MGDNLPSSVSGCYSDENGEKKQGSLLRYLKDVCDYLLILHGLFYRYGDSVEKIEI